MGHHYCSVNRCRNNTKMKTLSFFGLPKDLKRLRVWLRLIGRKDLARKGEINPASFRVCSSHFDPAMFRNKRLLPHAVPSLELPARSDEDDDEDGAPDNYEPGKILQNYLTSLTTDNEIFFTNETHSVQTVNTASKAVQTDFQCFCKSEPVTQQIQHERNDEHSFYVPITSVVVIDKDELRCTVTE